MRRESFTGFLTGPSLKAEPLKARLESQAREEAKQANCPFILLTTLKLVSKRSGGSMLGQIATGAARQGAWEAGARSGTAAGRIAGSAVYVMDLGEHNAVLRQRFGDRRWFRYQVPRGAAGMQPVLVPYDSVR